jgi:uncharacterized membrane protein (UPF0182 family)
MEPDLATALAKVFGKPVPGAGAAPLSPPSGAGSPPAGAPQPAADVATARDLYLKALEAQKKGDWAGYGRYIGDLGRVLEQIATPKAVQTSRGSGKGR